MPQDSHYDILFEPVTIGPVVAKNRFYQVPHCCGMGHLRPRAHAAMRRVKAQGGWAVVSTEETEIHPSSDLSPYAEQRLWDHRDIPALRLMTDAVHEAGALAAIELAHNGHHAPNHFSRTPALAPSELMQDLGYPRQARAMTRRDIAELRRWHRKAAANAKAAGFDIVYVYAGHRMSIAQHFLLPQYNDRSDEYGGSLENRARLIRELLEDTREEIGDSCAVAFRLAVDELQGADGMQAHEEGRAVVEMLAELPDLWDVNVAGWENDSQTTRLQPDDAYQIPYIEFVKQTTQKPVVAVGRLNSPDLMVSLVKRKVVDFIGSARSSIADPYLPTKIRDGRIDEIRECIGCNICVSSDNLGVPIRCTQNPTMGEEWRRGWHPEIIAPKESDDSALVVGAGPAGLECALQLSRRGYQVTVAEAGDAYGGRVLRESQLTGLSAWRRVVDNRLYELQRSARVEMYLQSSLMAADAVELGCERIFIATGAAWRGDGIGRSSHRPINGLEKLPIFTPDDIMDGNLPSTGPVAIYDDEHGYMGGVIADHLRAHGLDVVFVTSASVVSPWTAHTLEQAVIQRRLIEQDVDIHANRIVTGIGDGMLETACVYSHKSGQIPAACLVLVTMRNSHNTLARELEALADGPQAQPFKSVQLIGDALAPRLIADAVFSGHLAARDTEADAERVAEALFQREIPSLYDNLPPAP